MTNKVMGMQITDTRDSVQRFHILDHRTISTDAKENLDNMLSKHIIRMHKYKQLDEPSMNRSISACDFLALLFTANKSEKDCNHNSQVNVAPETIHK
jgi:hypothetical protein